LDIKSAPDSHQILTVIVDGLSHVTGARSHGCLHLIDLAGSERVGRSEASGAPRRHAECVRCISFSFS
jgi:kinesin family protein C2/C3